MARLSVALCVIVLVFGTAGGIACGAFAAGERPARPPGEPIEVGAARVEITPKEPIRLRGYGARDTRSTGVAQRIWARALAIGEEDPVLLVTADIIGVSGPMTDELARRLRDRGITRDRLAVCATHSHTAPFVELGGARHTPQTDYRHKRVVPNYFGHYLSRFEDEQIDRYGEFLLDQLEEVAREALADRSPAFLHWGQGSSQLGVNRRIIENGEWVGFGRVPEGPMDPDLPVLSVRDRQGNLDAVFLSYAAHATTLTGSFTRIHGDWPGEAAERIENAYPGAVALVALGAAGDINPQPRGDGLPDVRTNGADIAREVERVLEGEMRPLSGSPRVQYRRVDLPFDHVVTRSEWRERAAGDGHDALYAKLWLERLDAGQEVPSAMTLPVQVWSFGSNLAMVFLGGEVVVDYSLRMKEEFDSSRLWVNAYANNVTSYIASKRLIREGGYEVDGSMDGYDRPTRLAPEAEEIIFEHLHQMIPDSFSAR